MSSLEYVKFNGIYISVIDNKLNLSRKGIIDIAQIEGLSDLNNLESLSLNDNKIIEIKELENLKNLRSLSLAYNQITEIKGLENVENLVFFNIEGNEITEIKGLENLSKLEELIINGNNIREITGLENLINLKRLVFKQYGLIKSKFPVRFINWTLGGFESRTSTIKDPQKLVKFCFDKQNGFLQVVYVNQKPYYMNDKILYLGDLGIKEVSEIKGLEELNDLETLYLLKNHIKKIVGLEKLKKLKKLDLSQNLISEITSLGQLKELEYLGLSDNRISEIKNLDNLSNLKQLWLDGNNIQEIKGLIKLKNLKSLALGSNKISKIEGLDNLEDLTHLYLSENKIKDISNLKKLQKLITLYIGNNRINDITILGQLKALEDLSIPKNKIIDVTPLTKLPKLKDATLYGNKFPSNQFIKELDYINLKGKIANRKLQDLSIKEIFLLKIIAELNDVDAQDVYFKVLIDKARVRDLNSVNTLLDSSYIKNLDKHSIEDFFKNENYKPFFIFSIVAHLENYYGSNHFIEFLISNAHFISNDDKKIIGKSFLSLDPKTIIEIIKHGFLKCIDHESIEFLINDPKIKNKIMEDFGTSKILKEFLKYESKTTAKIMKEMLLDSINSGDYYNFSKYLENDYLNCFNVGEFEKFLEEHWTAFNKIFVKMIKKDFGVSPSKSLHIEGISQTSIKSWLQEIILMQINSGISSSHKKYLNFLSYLNDKSIVIALLEILEDHSWKKIFSDIKNLLLKTSNYNTKKLIQQLGEFINIINLSYRNYLDKIFEELDELLKCVIFGCYSVNISSVIEKIIIIFQLIITLNEVISEMIMESMDGSDYDWGAGLRDEEFERWFSIKKSTNLKLKIKNNKLTVSYPAYTLLKHKLKEFNQENYEFKLNTQMVNDENLLGQAWFKTHLHNFYEEKKYVLLLKNLTEKYKKKKKQEVEENDFNSMELIMFRNAEITRKEAQSLEDIELQTTKCFTYKEKFKTHNFFISYFDRDYITYDLEEDNFSTKEYLENFDEIIINTSMAFSTENHRVTGLSLKGSDIKKVPYSIGNLTELRELYITASDIWSKDATSGDFLPESVGNLKKLEVLKVKGQSITILPKSIGNLTNLYHLDLSGNHLENLPEAIGNLQLLRVLILDSNNIKRLPQSISKLKSLITLSLGGEGNFLLDTKSLRNLENLVFLNFLNNKFTEIPDLEGLPKLKVLKFTNNKLVEIKGLENLKNLRILDLTNNQISEIKCLENLINLRDLEFSENRISAIKGLEKLTNLERLGLSNNNISEIEGLNKLTNLKTLILSSNNIFEITGLAALTKLKTLGIDNNDIKELKGLENLMNLEELVIGTSFTKDLIIKLGGYKEEYNPLGEKYAQADDPSQFVEYCCKLVNKNVDFYKIREEKFDKLLREKFLVDNVKSKILKVIYDRDPNNIDLIVENLDKSSSGGYQHVFQLIEQKILIKESDTRTVRMNPPARSALKRIFNEKKRD